MTEISGFSVPAVQAAGRSGLVRRYLRSPLGVGALIVLLGIVAVAVFAPLIAPHDPGFASLYAINAAPGPEYLLGGDSAGRDILSRLIFGSRLTLVGALIAASVAVAVGVGFGLVAGYRAKSFDMVSSAVSDLVMVLPSMIVLVALYSVVGPNAYIAMSVLGIMLAPSFFRLTRNLVIQVRANLYVDAARVAGLSDLRIIGRHILSAVRAPIVIHYVLIMSVAIIIQAGLDFIGLGDPSVPTWGGMLQNAFRSIYQAPTSFVWPGLAIGITVTALLLIGNGLRDALEDLSPRVRRRRRSAVAVDSTTLDDLANEGVLLRVDDLTISYPRSDGSPNAVVESVGFDVLPGEVLGIVGESGSGKTQTALAILGLLPPTAEVTSGRIQFGELAITGADERTMTEVRGSRIAYIPQEPMSNLDPSAKIGEQLSEPMRVKLGLTRPQAKARALDLLRQVNIVAPERVFDSYPHEISGGMAQRVLIAGAVSCDPELIVADEPTTALDVTVQAEVLEVLRRLQRERRMSVILVTHNFGVVADVCDRVVVMNKGRVVETGDADEIFANPVDDYTKLLLGATLFGREPRAIRDAKEEVAR